MKLSFELLISLLAYCSIEKSIKSIEQHFQWEHNAKQTKSVLTYAIKQELLIQTPNQVKNGNKCPSMWVTNPKLTKATFKRINYV
ncbi:hypothetical protein [Psychromonas arctica]|uniref:hypothetical protein n=1 Tax=Psychromonas arctica TaxID=168275 RepID=UPI002FD4FE7A